MNNRELTGRTALVTGVTSRAGIGAAIARELGQAGVRLFVTIFRNYDQQQVWGVEPNEPESLLGERSDRRGTPVPGNNVNRFEHAGLLRHFLELRPARFVRWVH